MPPKFDSPLSQTTQEVRGGVLRDAALSLLSDMPRTHGASEKEASNTTSSSNKNLAREIYSFAKRNFGAIDDDGDKTLSRVELKLYLTHPSISLSDRRIATLLLRNYEDLDSMTDDSKRGHLRKPKLRQGITLNDVAMLRTASDPIALEEAIEQRKAMFGVSPYLGFAFYGILFGFAGACAAGKYLRLRSPAPPIVIGTTIGLVSAYALSRLYRRSYDRACENYYDEKRELSEQLLQRMKK
jgi:hypothetical protein